MRSHSYKKLVDATMLVASEAEHSHNSHHNNDGNNNKPTKADALKKMRDEPVVMLPDGQEVYILDPSELFRPEYKAADEYRQYTTNQVCQSLCSLVSLHYITD